jgi:protein-tyrosine phosphatase
MAATLRALALPAGVPGRVWLSAMPGRLDSWPRFLLEAQAAGIQEVVCLNPLFEVERASPAYAAAVAQQDLPFRWTHLPMQDYGLAASQDAYLQAVTDLAGRVRGGDVILLHCAAGIGRTGTTAACLLKQLGATTAQALQWVRNAGSDPESALQRGLIERL